MLLLGLKLTDLREYIIIPNAEVRTISGMKSISAFRHVSGSGLATWILTLSVPFLAPITDAIAGDAASTDWQPGATGQCRGSYIEPKRSAGDLADDRVRASAESALHVRDHSTTLNGDVRISQRNQTLTADFASIDAVTETYTAEGDVALRQPGLLITGETIKGNLFSGTAFVDSASFLLHANRVRGSAASISRDDTETLTIAGGSFTTCEPDSDTWAISGEEIRLFTRDGYGTARDVTLRIKDLPVAYVPYLRFPIDDSRQSGFLVPSAGHDNDGGTDIAVPYYFNLRPNLDATYTLRSIWKRGVMHEAELRYLNASSTNTIAATFLPSDDIYDGRDVITATNPDEEDRWLTHINHRGQYGLWSSRINFTSVSDIDYFHDLGGFTATRTQFDRVYDESDAPALLRTGSLGYTRDNWQAMLELRSFQELSQLRPEQYAVLPRLTLTGRHQLAALRLQATAQLTEFDRSGNTPDGTRMVLDTRATLPLQNTWGFLTPGIRIIHRDYDLNRVATVNRDSASLTTTLASLDAGLIFERRTEFRGQKLRQTLEPRIYFLHAEEDFQDDLPSFDSTPLTPSFENLFRDVRFTGYDRIGDADQVSLGITSSFYDSRGRQLLSASLGQRFYLEDRQVNYGLTPGIDPTADLSPLFMTLQTSLGHLQLNASYEFDADQGRSNRGFLGMRYRTPGGAAFDVTYTMTEQSIQRAFLPRNEEETDISFVWPLSPAWTLLGRWNYGLDNRQTIESLVGVEYNDCCWRARIVFRRELEEPRLLRVEMPGMPTRFVTDRRADSGIYFEFQLRGLASLGGRLNSMIQDSIPGFDPR
jgi:LPS-assembly protein